MATIGSGASVRSWLPNVPQRYTPQQAPEYIGPFNHAFLVRPNENQNVVGNIGHLRLRANNRGQITGSD
jgi:hypothetical protein